MADNRPPRRDEEIMTDEEVIVDEIPTRRAIRSHNPEGKWYYLN